MRLVLIYKILRVLAQWFLVLVYIAFFPFVPPPLTLTLSLSLAISLARQLTYNHLHLMRSFRFVLSCFNFLAHLLCALVIYLLSKLCCNKILTICFISSELHRLPCLSFLYAAFPFLIYFILFDSVVFALVSPISIYSLYLALATLCIVHSFASRFFITRTLSPSWSINWWYCGNIEMSVFISFLVFFLFLFPAGTSHPHPVSCVWS